MRNLRVAKMKTPFVYIKANKRQAACTRGLDSRLRGNEGEYDDTP